MDDAIESNMLEAARRHYRTQLRQHAQQCVLLAVVTTERISAELIDKAIALRAELKDE